MSQSNRQGNSLRVFSEATATVVDTANDSTVVTTQEAILYGVHVTTALSAHSLPIQNAAGTTIVALAASAAVGTFLSLPMGVRMTGITVNPNDAATGGIVTVLWTPA